MNHNAFESICKRNDVAALRTALRGGLFKKGLDPNTSSYDSGSSDTLLSLAAMWGSIKVVELLLEFGASPNLGIGTTPLIRAAASPNDYCTEQTRIGICKLLLEAGANMSLTNEGGANVFYYTDPKNNGKKNAALHSFLLGWAVRNK